MHYFLACHSLRIAAAANEAANGFALAQLKTFPNVGGASNAGLPADPSATLLPLPLTHNLVLA